MILGRWNRGDPCTAAAGVPFAAHSKRDLIVGAHKKLGIGHGGLLSGRGMGGSTMGVAGSVLRARRGGARARRRAGTP